MLVEHAQPFLLSPCDCLIQVLSCQGLNNARYSQPCNFCAFLDKNPLNVRKDFSYLPNTSPVLIPASKDGDIVVVGQRTKTFFKVALSCSVTLDIELC